MVPDVTSADKRMRLRRAGSCRLCGGGLAAGTEAVYERASKTVRCVDCPSPAAPSVAQREDAPLEPPLEAGVAGASARREYERRRARDEERLRARWGRFGGVAVALSDERQSTTAWDRGAVGEERLGVRLDGLADAGCRVLHDRRIPGSRANIDHLLVTAAGVWVVDAKRYQGRRPGLRVEGGILRPRVEKLLVGGRDCTKLVDGVLKQVALVVPVVAEVTVRGSMCFLDADWPLIGGSFSTRGVAVLWPSRLEKLLRGTPGAGVDVEETTRRLAGHFPPA